MDYIIQDIERFLTLLDDFFQNLKKCGTYNPFHQNDERAKLLFTIALNLCDSSNCVNEIRKKMVELNEIKEKNNDLKLRRGGWRELIPSCFGCADGKFARNKCDEDCAKKIRKIVSEENIDLECILQEFRLYLDKIFPKQSSQKESEMELVEDFFKR